MSQVKAGAAYVELLTRDAKLVKGLAAAQRRLQDFGASTKALGASLFALGAAAAAPLGMSAATFAAFDDGMRAVRAVTQATAEDFAKLTEEAKRLGATTSFSASEVATLMTELGRAGFKPDQVIAMTAAVMNLARATGTDATESAGFMAATIRQFGLEAGEATRVADGLTAAANKSFNSVNMLGEALSYAGPVAADANMSLEETLAILGTLGNMGIQGSEAGTALRRLLVLTAAEAEKFTETFGVATADAAGNTRPLVDILGEVAEAANNLPTAERGKKFAEVFGMLGITSASAIGKTAANTKELLAEIQAATGVAASSAAEMESGIGGAFRILKSSVEGVAIAIGEALEGPLRKMTDAASGAFSGLIKWIEANHEAIQNFAKVALGLIAAGAAIFAIGSAFAASGAIIAGVVATLGMVGTLVSVIGSAFALLITPIGATIAGVVALGGYLLTTTGAGGKALDILGAKFGQLFDTASEAIGLIGEALKRGDIAAASRILWAALEIQWLKGVNALTQIWMAAKNAILNITDSLFSSLNSDVADVWGQVETAWVETIDFLSDAWSLFAGGLMSTWHSTVGFIRKAWTRLKSLFDSDIDVEAEVTRINAETDGKIAENAKGTADEIRKRDADRKARLAEISGRGDEIDKKQAERRAQREAEVVKSNEDLAKATEALKLEMALASAESASLDPSEWGADKRAEAKAKDEADNNSTAAIEKAMDNAIGDALNDQINNASNTDDPTKDLEAELKNDVEIANEFRDADAEAEFGDPAASYADTIDEMYRRAESVSDTASTFQAASIRGLGADSLADRQITLLAQIAASTAKTADNTEEGVAFA